MIIESVAVQITVDVDVPGIMQEGRTRLIAFSYKPEPDDPLVAALLAKEHELLIARMQAGGQTGIWG